MIKLCIESRIKLIVQMESVFKTGLVIDMEE